ncbi:hypothetical protein AGLY_015896 [Aphis glycines]|uniref:Uncharacterized protein n=1 Tax=Aphis glycines TaxID=307491 RepID=A0A6G0SZV1_APHGL|nr:hypothetical protein AGLY_015896 [Aphis glycines]
MLFSAIYPSALLFVASTVSTVVAGDNFVEDFILKPWKILPLYHTGKILHDVVVGEKVNSNDVISSTGILGSIIVAATGENNVNGIVEKTASTVNEELEKFINTHHCGPIGDFSPTTQALCHSYAFNTKTLDESEVVFMSGCMGLDIGSYMAPLIVDLGTMPLQMACSEWFDYRIELYAHIKDVPVEDYDFLFDLPSGVDNPGVNFIIAYDNETSAGSNGGQTPTTLKDSIQSIEIRDGDFQLASVLSELSAGGALKRTVAALKAKESTNAANVIKRTRRGLLGTAVKKSVGHAILKMIRPTKIFNTVVTTYAKTFRGPTGKVLTETTENVIKSVIQEQMTATDATFQISEGKLLDLAKRYILAPEIVVRRIKIFKHVPKIEKISLVKEAIKKYRPNQFIS